ncbi:hypothetical protein [Xanthomarina gelatinilytica]|uniref:hypothetical protein n=1 Tax=Xanthomarina gelatinilytica TaxID=1137281 RepID=UPI003AA86772
MAKIEVFKLDIDVDAAIKAQSELKTNVDVLKNALDGLKKSGDTNSRTYVEMEAAYKNLNREYNASQTQLGKLIDLQGKEITTVQEGRNALTILNKEWAKATNLYGENSKEAEELGKKHKVLKDRVNELQKGVGDTSGNIGNYTKSMTEALNQTSLFGVSITTVTQYTSLFGAIFKTAGQEIAVGTTQIWNAAAGTEGLSKAQKAATVTTNILSGALKILKVVLISTGIGAIVVVLGSLIAYLSSTQKGIDLVTSVTRPLSAIFSTLTGILQKVGEFLFNAFANPKKTIEDVYNFVKDKVIRVFNGYFDILAGIATLNFDRAKQGLSDINDVAVEGINAIKNAAGQIGDAFAEAYKKGQRIDELQKSIEQKEIDIIAYRAEQERQLKVQENIQKNQLLSATERNKAIEEGERIAKEMVERENEILDLQIEQLKIKQSLNDTSREEEKELQALVAQRIKNSERILDVEKRALGDKKQLAQQAAQQAAAATKKAQDDAINANKDLLDLFIAQQGFKKKSDEDELKAAREIRDKKLAILQQELDFKRISQTDFDAQSIELKNEYLEKERDIVIANAERERDELLQNIEKRKTDYANYTQEKLDNEIAKIQDAQLAQEEFAKQQFEQGVTNEQDYQDALAQIKVEAREREDEAVLEWEEANKERKLIDLENQRLIDEENFVNDFELRASRLELQKQQELANAEKTGASKALIIQKYANLEKKIEIEKENAKLEIGAQTFGGLAKLLGEHTAAGKAAAVAEATINTFAGVAQVWRAQSILPEPLGTIQKVLSTAIVLGSGLSAVSKIKSTNVPKAEKGALFRIGGRRHSAGGTRFRGEDGTEFEAERDEILGVMNRNAAAAFMAFNDAYPAGGSTRSNYMATGGIVERIANSAQSNAGSVSVNDPFDYDKFAAKVAEANQSLPAPYVAVTEINDGQGKYAKLVDEASF